MEDIAQVEIDALARQAHRCEVCKAAPGTAIFDTTWACAACRELLIRRLENERNIGLAAWAGPWKGSA